MLSPVYYSTLAGAKAFSLPNQPSCFTEVLLKGLNGGGADDANDDWRVNTTRLKEAIDVYMDRLFDSGRAAHQTPATDNLSTFTLHFCRHIPDVDVTVRCSPDAATCEATFDCRCSDNEQVHLTRDVPAQEPWEIRVAAGRYEFSAGFPNNRFPAKQDAKEVRPPRRDVRLEVGNG